MKMREWKENALIAVRRIAAEDNEVDICTKKVDNEVFKRHLPRFVGKEKNEDVET